MIMPIFKYKKDSFPRVKNDFINKNNFLIIILWIMSIVRIIKYDEFFFVFCFWFFAYFIVASSVEAEKAYSTSILIASFSYVTSQCVEDICSIFFNKYLLSSYYDLNFSWSNRWEEEEYVWEDRPSNSHTRMWEPPVVISTPCSLTKEHIQTSNSGFGKSGKSLRRSWCLY